MSNYIEQAKLLSEIPGLEREAVGVRFLKDINSSEAWLDYDQSTKLRYCQAVMLAGQGKKILLSSQNIACAAAGAAFGLIPLHPKLASGEGHFNSGVFGKIESAARIMKEMPRLDQGVYNYIAIAPLKEISDVPDVVVIEASPEIVMWISLAAIYNTGERLQMSTSVVQATCVDATIVPMISGKPNASFGCTGCREATDLTTIESLIGFPGRELDHIVENLKFLSEKTIPQNRSKSIYNNFLSKK